MSHRIRAEIITENIRRDGKSNVMAKCLNCNYVNKIYIWSYAGSGKKCNNCKAPLKLVKKEVKNE